MPIQVDTFVQALKKLKLTGGPFLALAIVVILLGSTAFYTVNQDEVGIVQRFGRYIETTQPGLNFKLPLGIDTVTKVNVKSVRPRSSVLSCRKSITVIDRNPILMRAARRSC